MKYMFNRFRCKWICDEFYYTTHNTIHMEIVAYIYKYISHTDTTHTHEIQSHTISNPMQHTTHFPIDNTPTTRGRHNYNQYPNPFPTP